MAIARVDGAGRDRGVVVVEVGGCLLENGRARSLLGVISRSRRTIVIVPEGGALATAARKMRDDLDLSPAAAHRMELLAMHQCGIAMADLQPRLIAVETLSAMRRSIAVGRIPVWLPTRLSERDPTIPTDGTTTADGLAAKLATRIGASLVLLLKSRRVRRGARVSDLAGDGIVDSVFAEIVARERLPFRVLGPAELPTLAEILGAAAHRSLSMAACRAMNGRARRKRRQGRGGAALSGSRTG